MREYDAIIVGAGPAGSAVATILADAGRRVLVLERESFPRYRVGESLIPYSWFSLERLGVLDRIRQASFAIEKKSVQFASMDGEHVTPFYFSSHTDHDCARTWQIRRDDFDRMLVDNAVERGAEVRFESSARELVREGDRIVGVRTDTDEFRAPLTIDASGRDLFAVNRLDWRTSDPVLRKIAVWSYFKGAKRDQGDDEGATTIAYLPDKGWFWFIPLADDVASVGVVADRDYLYRDLEQREPQVIFEREVEVQRWIADRLAPAERVGPFHVTGDYSYRAKHCASDGLLLVGDAYAFLDPVFSSGLFFALQSGVLGADVILDIPRDRAPVASDFTDYAVTMRRRIESMRRLVYAFYDHGFSFGRLIHDHPDLRRDLTDCLIGNLDRDFDPLFDAIARMASLPEPMAHGMPLGDP